MKQSRLQDYSTIHEKSVKRTALDTISENDYER